MSVWAETVRRGARVPVRPRPLSPWLPPCPESLLQPEPSVASPSQECAVTTSGASCPRPCRGGVPGSPASLWTLLLQQSRHVGLP